MSLSNVTFDMGSPSWQNFDIEVHYDHGVVVATNVTSTLCGSGLWSDPVLDPSVITSCSFANSTVTAGALETITFKCVGSGTTALSLPGRGAQGLDGVGNALSGSNGDFTMTLSDGSVSCGAGAASQAGGIITNVAGNGTTGYSGDGHSATSAALWGAYGLALDHEQDLYIADSGNCVIRKVTAGVISTVAGDGYCGYEGDGGPATLAKLDHPDTIIVDAQGNLYLADYLNCTIREVTNGFISRIAGNGLCGSSLGDGGAATAAELGRVDDLAVDGNGVLYIADAGHLRKIVDGVITDVTPPQTTIGRRIAANEAGDVVFLDDRSCTVDKIVDGVSVIIAGHSACGSAPDQGLATSMYLNYPDDVGLDAAGNVYISEDAGNCRIRTVRATDDAMWTVAGNGQQCGSGGDGGTATSADINPGALVVGTEGTFFFTEIDRIRKVSGIDTDGDGCADDQEAALSPPLSPADQWDFFSVPVPALIVAPAPFSDFRDSFVAGSDAQAVFAYFKAGAKSGTTVYDQDLNNNGIADGVEYDRTVMGPGMSGPPDGVVGSADAQLAFAQFKSGYHC